MNSCVRCGGWTDDSLGICPACDRGLRCSPMRIGDAEFLVYRGVALPPRCVRCGASIGRGDHPDHAPLFRPERLIDHSLIGFAARLAFPKRFHRPSIGLFVPMCRAHVRRRRTLRWIGAVLVAAIVPVLWIGVLPHHEEDLTTCGLISLALCAVGMTVVWVAGRHIRPTEINERFARFAGAGEAFLAQLPRD